MGKDHLDCVFIGSSVVNRGINPAIFEVAYTGQAGETIQCFNLGLGWTTASGAAAWAEYVIKTYHPQLLIYGVTPRDFSPSAVERGFSTDDLQNLAWMRYARSEFDLEGWILHHSQAYRYYLLFSRWAMPDFDQELNVRREQEAMLAAQDGQTVLDPVADPLAAIQRGKPDKRYMAYYANYEPEPGELARFARTGDFTRPAASTNPVG